MGILTCKIGKLLNYTSALVHYLRCKSFQQKAKALTGEIWVDEVVRVSLTWVCDAIGKSAVPSLIGLCYINT